MTEGAFMRHGPFTHDIGDLVPAALAVGGYAQHRPGFVSRIRKTARSVIVRRVICLLKVDLQHTPSGIVLCVYLDEEARRRSGLNLS